jgi:membrane-associated phospholipid phosphatase
LKHVLYDWGDLNVRLFQVLNGFHSDALDSAGLLAAALARPQSFPYFVALFSLLGAYRMTRQAPAQGGTPARGHALQWFSVVFVFSAVYILDEQLTAWAQGWFAFPRPPVVLGADNVHVAGKLDGLYRSFPSSGASIAVLVAASLWPVLGLLGRIVAVLFVVWVGFSRINLGAHFPADVLWAWVKTLLLVWVIRALFKILVPRRGG